MHRAKLLTCALVLVGATGGGASALASPAKSPAPTAGSPSCNGLIVSDTNHASGTFGASGNPLASAGPGYFLQSQSHQAIVDVRTEACG
jgi:hypothetical protein